MVSQQVDRQRWAGDSTGEHDSYVLVADKRCSALNRNMRRYRHKHESARSADSSTRTNRGVDARNFFDCKTCSCEVEGNPTIFAGRFDAHDAL